MKSVQSFLAFHSTENRTEQSLVASLWEYWLLKFHYSIKKSQHFIYLKIHHCVTAMKSIWSSDGIWLSVHSFIPALGNFYPGSMLTAGLLYITVPRQGSLKVGAKMQSVMIRFFSSPATTLMFWYCWKVKATKPILNSWHSFRIWKFFLKGLIEVASWQAFQLCCLFNQNVFTFS